MTDSPLYATGAGEIFLCDLRIQDLGHSFHHFPVFYYHSDGIPQILITFYVCAAFGFVILFVLNKLIKNIGSEKVFIDENVKLLKILSYCCFAIAVVTLIFARFRILVFVITFAAAFIGLILRVIKNCFTEAIRLREENDFTI